MTKADTIFKENIERILKDGVFSEQARPKYKDGTVANSKYVTGAFAEYDLSMGEFPITTLRPIAIKSAIKEVLWIYQDQSNSLDILNDKYNVHYWNDWEVGDTGTIGERYGAVVKKHDIINKILKQLEANPWNRRNIISLWDYQAFEETDGLLPCAFQTMFDVRRVDGDIYLDATLTQRSNDMLVAHHINAMQYVALQMMIAKHFGWKVGKFFYFINNLHIYDNQFEQAQELLRREPSNCQPRLVLNVPDGTNFFDIKAEDFELVGDENIYIFGEDSETVIDLYAKAAYNSNEFYNREAIKPLVDFIVSDVVLAVGNQECLYRLHNELINKDWFMTLLDLENYIQVKEQMLADYEDRDVWLDKVIVNIAKAGFFSSDRTIAQYNEDIWHLN